MGNLKSEIKRGVILAAGYGTRFLPVTKTIPKEMLPIIDVPSIEYIIREFIDSGISKILLITSRRKKVLEDYFDKEIELEEFLVSNNKKQLQNRITDFNAEFYFIRQKKMLGTGDALMLAEDFTKGEPFVVAYPDDVVISKIPLTLRLINAFKDTGRTVIAVEEIASNDSGRYGIVTAEKSKNGLLVKKIHEKPKLKTNGSVIASLGRYLFTPELFAVLKMKNTAQQSKESASLIDSLNHLAKDGMVVGVEIDGTRYDLGQPAGYVKAITHAALHRVDIRDEYVKYLRALLGV